MRAVARLETEDWEERTMRFGFAVWLVAAGSAAGAVVASCGPTESSCEELATCPVTGGAGGAGGNDAGMSGAGGSAGTGSTVDASADVGSSDAAVPPCGDAGIDPRVGVCVDNEAGVFVSLDGDDDANTGTRDSPYKTIKNGLEKARARGPGHRLFICKGEYTEAIAINATLDGADVYGGFDCDNGWMYGPENRTVVKPAAPGVPLSVRKVTALAVHDSEFDAADAGGAGESSIAVLVSESSGVTFTRVQMTAGKGAAGLPGTTWSASASPGAPGNPGHDACGASPNNGGDGAQSLCDGAVASIGGEGGRGAVASIAPGGSGGDGLLATANMVGHGGAGEPVSGTWSCAIKGNGQAGDDGANGSAGAGTKTQGTLGAMGWTGGKGEDGNPGTSAQGGGGGGGARAPSACEAGTQTGASGGSGGGGGCGGKGGGGGVTGGLSIALVSYDAGVTLVSCRLQSSSGGTGGYGSAGQHGGAGGAGEKGGSGPVTDGCKGGDGGKGGNGGPGGGGAGGHSLGIAYSTGKAPTVRQSTFQHGTAGGAGSDGNGSASGTGAGATGQAADQLEF